jgi:NAD(P)-dependent dehydrogenase (short-subunit alcohol dehydrogenase family)
VVAGRTIQVREIDVPERRAPGWLDHPKLTKERLMPPHARDLQGKVAIVTGATKGMGAAIAERFAAGGARVVISSRTAQDVERKVEDLNARHGGGQTIAVGARCVIEDKADLAAIVELALQRFGKITTLVANACGMAWLGASSDMPDDQLDFQFLTVFKSKFWLVNLALPSMIAAGGGSIVFIGSGSAFEATSERNVYAAMRAAEVAYARNLAAEHGAANIRANVISPGLIRTFSSGPLFANEEVRAGLAASVPLRRTGEAEEIAAAAAFLASDTSSFTTGLVLPVDGGRLINARPKTLTKVYGADTRAS